MRKRLFIGAGAAAVLVVGILAATGALGGGGGDGDGSCLAADLPLTPTGTGPDAYTMGIRVNEASDVDEIESAIGDRIEPRDVFVLNSEVVGSDPHQWDDTFAKLHDTFDCNRIIALNGLGTKAGKAGYERALAANQDVDAILLDWEPDSWEGAGRGAWDPDLNRNQARIKQVFTEMQADLKQGDTRLGIVPDYIPQWDYGQTAKTLGQLNWSVNPLFRGYQIVQTQPNCGTPGAVGPLIGPLANQLRGQYKPLFDLTPSEKGWIKASERTEIMLQHLGFEIAFSTSPNPKSSEAVERIGPEQAAECSKQIVDSGGAGILYWADADSLKAMLDTPAGRAIRPQG